MSEPEVEVIPARVKDRAILWRLLQLYLHDFSEIDGRAVDERGEFEYRWFDHYWNEAERSPLLFRVDGEWAGFALIRRGAPNQMAEFFIMRKYRRSGVGRRVAAECFKRFPGHWLIHQFPGNDAAIAFWRAAIPVPFQETSNARGTTQRFEVRCERTADQPSDARTPRAGADHRRRTMGKAANASIRGRGRR